MSTPADRSVPLAVLVGSSLIAIAVFFGLRGRAPVPAPAPVAGPVTASTEPPIERSVVERAVQNALESQKSLFIERCWAPSAKLAPLPATSGYAFELHIDENGHEVARGISESDGARADVAKCMRLIVAPVTVPAPRQRVVARVRLELP